MRRRIVREHLDGQGRRSGERARLFEAAGAAREIDIVYTGLRPGEKLTEDLLGRGEVDDRPCPPLIRHVQVPPLAPAEVMSLDPDAAVAELRAALARCSDSAHPGLTRS